MSNGGRSIQKWGLCSEWRHSQKDLFKAATSHGGSAPFSTPSHMPFHQPGHLNSLLPCVTASPTHQGPCSHGCPLSACSHREHQLTNAENDTKLMLSICLVTSTYGCGITGARECKDSLAEPKRRGDTQGATTFHHLLHYPNTLFTFASRWHSLYVWLVHNPGAHFPKCSEQRWDILCPYMFHGTLPFTHLCHGKGYDFSRVHITREIRKMRRWWAEMFLGGRKDMMWAAGRLEQPLASYATAPLCPLHPPHTWSSPGERSTEWDMANAAGSSEGRPPHPSRGCASPVTLLAAGVPMPSLLLNTTPSYASSQLLQKEII